MAFCIWGIELAELNLESNQLRSVQMEQSRVEIEVVQKVVEEAASFQAVLELNLSQLALVGGGSGDVQF